MFFFCVCVYVRAPLIEKIIIKWKLYSFIYYLYPRNAYTVDKKKNNYEEEQNNKKYTKHSFIS